MSEFESVGWTNRSIEVEFTNVDPAVLAILTGSAIGGDVLPTSSVEVWAPIPWRWWQWQWWLRRPKRQQYILLPNVRLVSGNPDE